MMNSVSNMVQNEKRDSAESRYLEKLELDTSDSEACLIMRLMLMMRPVLRVPR
jgi:hypothetical protein